MTDYEKFKAAVRLAGLDIPLDNLIKQNSDGKLEVRYNQKKHTSIDIKKFLPLFSILDNLIYLEIKNSKDPSFKHILELNQLEVLILENFKTQIPEEINNLSKLRTFRFSRSRIKSLPTSFTDLKNLETLWLQENSLEVLPEDIGKLKNLRTLFLQGNSLSHLPDSIVKLEKLRVIILDRNNFTSFPSQLLEMKKLEGIGLKRNNIGYIPKEIVKLKNLKTLNLNYTSIQEVPDTISKFWSENTPLAADSIGRRKRNDF